MKITYYGHACIYLETNGLRVIIDPFISGNPLVTNIDLESIKVDFILLTHAHNDHILDAEFLAKENDAIIVSNYEIANHYEKLGVKTHPMSIGGSWQFPFGKVKMVIAHHTSSFQDGSYGGNPAGFLIESDKNIYIAGDTALTFDMKLIPMQTKLDLVVLPIGDNFTMGVGDAILASDFLECNTILGYHFDTFGYIKVDKNEAILKFKNAQKKLILLEIEESLEL